MTNNEIIEAFLTDVEAQGAASFNIPAATNWINANFTRPGGSWEKHEISRMVQGYCHSQSNHESTRSGVFKPSYVIDCDRRGGPNAVWTIHSSVGDATTSMHRTAHDLAEIAVNRMVQRVNPTLAKDPAAMAQFQPVVTAMEANLKVIAALTNTLP